MLRVGFDLLQSRLWWWGALLLAIGLATALFGVVFASVQVDMKRLLAYTRRSRTWACCSPAPAWR